MHSYPFFSSSLIIFFPPFLKVVVELPVFTSWKNQLFLVYCSKREQKFRQNFDRKLLDILVGLLSCSLFQVRSVDSSLVKKQFLLFLRICFPKFLYIFLFLSFCMTYCLEVFGFEDFEFKYF